MQDEVRRAENEQKTRANEKKEVENVQNEVWRTENEQKTRAMRIKE